MLLEGGEAISNENDDVVQIVVVTSGRPAGCNGGPVVCIGIAGGGSIHTTKGSTCHGLTAGVFATTAVLRPRWRCCDGHAPCLPSLPFYLLEFLA
ncbi:hypothetical protein PIB30_093599, partial [Stylosanthes scabra]|nr:hypothetical protein [Stylosanthes scabra]